MKAIHLLHAIPCVPYDSVHELQLDKRALCRSRILQVAHVLRPDDEVHLINGLRLSGQRAAQHMFEATKLCAVDLTAAL